MTLPTHDCDLLVIGAGVAGMAAALFASSAGVNTHIAGSVGGIDFTTGFLDVLGVHPMEKAQRRDDPWEALAELAADYPSHPYAKLTQDEITESLRLVTDFFAKAGLPFTGSGQQNTRVLTTMGTIKRTYRLPQSMWHGAQALEKKSPCIIVDFQGLKGFSSAQLREMQAQSWPALRSLRIDFPDQTEELYPEHMAWAMESPPVRKAIAAAVRPHLNGEQYVGFPSILGHDTTSECIDHLEALLGAKVFEIPTLPPSLSGIRMRAAFDRELPKLGVRMHSQKMILSAREEHNVILCTAGREQTEAHIRAKAVILATGRFFGKGLSASRHGVNEVVFNLPLVQPGSRKQWHNTHFYAPAGHPINQAGVMTDAWMRLLNHSTEIISPRIFAAGAILANQDWARQKCGSGLAIATAYKAVQSAIEFITENGGR